MTRIVSVVVFSYNFESIIARTISSVTAQSLVRELDIVFHDDASTDASFLIAESVARIRGTPFIPVLRKNNRMSRRVPIWADILEKIDSKYVAILDGDDFWVDPRKLEAQVAVLDSRPDVDICFSRALTFDGIRFSGVTSNHGTEIAHFTLKNVIDGDGGFMPTSSILVRSNVLLSAPDWFFSFWPLGDFQIQVLGSKKGGAVYLPFDLAAYRTGDPRSFTSRIFSNPKLETLFRLDFINLLAKMQKDFDVQLWPSFVNLARQNLVRIAQIGEFGDLARGALDASGSFGHLE